MYYVVHRMLRCLNECENCQNVYISVGSGHMINSYWSSDRTNGRTVT